MEQINFRPPSGEVWAASLCKLWELKEFIMFFAFGEENIVKLNDL